MPNRVGFARAAEMAMLGERLLAPQALEWGLINRVFADDAPEGEIDRLAQRLADGLTQFTGAKRQLNACCSAAWRSSSSLEASIQQEMNGSDDFHEGERIRAEAHSVLPRTLTRRHLGRLAGPSA